MAIWHTMEGLNAPDLVGRPEDWINFDERATGWNSDTLYLVDFWDYTCVNCLRTLPYVREWYARYADLDFLVIGVHTPEFDFAKDRKNVEEAVRRLGIDYPVLMDNDYLNWQLFANHYWPRKYLIRGSDHKVILDRIGEGGYAELEFVIQKEISQRYPDVSLPGVMEPVRPQDQPDAVCYPVTPEIYTGYKRGNIGNPGGFRDDADFEYTDTGKRNDGVTYLQGLWHAEYQLLKHARKTRNLEDYLILPYHAIEVNAVMQPAGGGEFTVFVELDGEPVHEHDAGADIQFTSEGLSYIDVDWPRMYKIIHSAELGWHTLKLSSNSDGFGIYAFTFGSCEERR